MSVLVWVAGGGIQERMEGRVSASISWCLAGLWLSEPKARITAQFGGNLPMWWRMSHGRFWFPKGMRAARAEAYPRCCASKESWLSQLSKAEQGQWNWTSVQMVRWSLHQRCMVTSFEDKIWGLSTALSDLSFYSPLHFLVSLLLSIIWLIKSWHFFFPNHLHLCWQVISGIKWWVRWGKIYRLMCRKRNHLLFISFQRKV